MPTPGGLPKKGDRVRFSPKILGEATETIEGTVHQRSGGAYWALTIDWDNGRRTQMVDAPWFFQNGQLTVVSKGAQ